jgi:hypothetical protein
LHFGGSSEEKRLSARIKAARKWIGFNRQRAIVQHTLKLDKMCDSSKCGKAAGLTVVFVLGASAVIVMALYFGGLFHSKVRLEVAFR